MKIIQNLNKRVKRLDLIDIKLLKWSVFIVGLVVGARFSFYVLPYWWILVIIAISLILRPFYRYWLMLFKK